MPSPKGTRDLKSGYCKLRGWKFFKTEFRAKQPNEPGMRLK
jgi:hypothetical protein